MHIIAIDCGASFIKAARLDEAGVILRRLQRDTPASQNPAVTQAHPCEPAVRLAQAPCASYTQLEHTLHTIREMITTLTDPGGAFFLAVSNEMHGFVLADSEGRPYLDYISWQDEAALLPYRDENYLTYVRTLLRESDILDTGMPLKCGLPSVNLFYYLHTTLSGIPANTMYFYTLGDYILRQLSGRAPFTHPTNAAASGLYSLTRKQWHTDMIDRLGLAKIHFPAIDAKRTLTFTLADRTLTAYPAVGDQQAALLGAGLSRPGELSVNMGTGAQAAVLCPVPVLSADYQTRPYFNGAYIKTIPHIPSGRALNVYFRLIKEISGIFCVKADDSLIWQAIMEEVESCSFEPMDIDLSFFSNAITSHQIGSIMGIKEKEFSLGNLFRSIFIKMADNVNLAAQKIIGAEPADTILFSGGIMQRNAFLRSLIIAALTMNAAHEPSWKVSSDDTFLGLAAYVQNDGAV